ncbi:MAG TPA: choice-of-anchor Q domain-containing protein [Verrucomicrobiae bacterium]|nr:choice-of-anchor Q domain-containing protein [Verrucomicrobiae bacterium]
MKTALRLTAVMVLLVLPRLSAATLYVSRGSPNPTPPYATWATAATNIQDAVDSAQAQALILVTDGVYPGGLTVGKPLTLLSVNGPRVTVIDGAGSKQCVSITNGVNLSGFTLTNGWAQNGGAVWCSTTNAYVTNCVIAGNSAAQNGGGTYGATFYNCQLTGNSATSGIGGGACSSMLYNCTVTGNSASTAGGASGGILYNSIIYFNNAPHGANYTNVYYLLYCCTTPLPNFGGGNITNAPMLVDYAGGDLHLQSNSPCIDAGNNMFVHGATDLDGNPRIFGGTVDLGAYEFEPSGPPLITGQPSSQTAFTGSDVTLSVVAVGSLPLSWQWQFKGVAIPGALNSTLTLAPVTTNQAGSYSVVVANNLGSVTSQVAVVTVTNSAPRIVAQPLDAVAYVGSNVTFTVGAVGSLPFSWQWQFNGTAIPNATNSSLTLTAVTTNQEGLYSVIVSNALGSLTSAAASLTVAVRTGTSFVWQNSPNPTPPYATWPTAAHAIQDAVDATIPGDQVVVTNGIYATGARSVGSNALPNRVVVDKPVTVRSVNGPDVTVIMGYQVPGETNGYAAIRCVYLSSGAVLNGFTLTNGATLYPVGNFDPQASGGGVWCQSSSAVVTNCILNGNAAAQFSGGADGGTIDNCALSGNSALYGGGAHGGTLNFCTLTGNSAQYGGGAHVATLNNCTLTGNSAQVEGGGAESCTLANSAVFGNSAQANGGGAAFCTLTNCTVTFNSAAVYDGGAYDSMLYNSIVYYNTVLNSTKISDAMSSTLYYCCSTTNSGGNTITNEPFLLSPWRPAWNSPVRGAGNSAFAGGSDLDGETWLNPPSIGCDEYHSGLVTGALSVAIVAPVTNVARGVALDLIGQVSGRPSAARWEFGDGTVISNRLHATHQWPAAGDYQVVWRAYNDSLPAGVTAAVTIHVLDTSLHYVNIESTSPLAPYTTWSTAAATIQDAVDAASPGDEILVTNGVYAAGGRPMGTDLLTNRVTLNKPLTVRSVNGPEATVIEGYQVSATVEGPGAIRCAYLSAGSVLSGFTLTNGATLAQPSYSDPQANGGGAWCESTSVLTNCTLVGNSALSAGGVYGGTLYNCTLTSNSVPWYGGGTYGATLNNCTLTGNSAYGGAGVFGGVINNCILTDNSAAWYGGGAENCTLYYCTLTQNSSGEYGGGVSHCTLYNCTLTGNTGQGVDGGTLYNCRLFGNSSGSSGTFYSCLLVGNNGASSGAFYNCTVVQNQGGIAGSALNSIVYYNVGGNYAPGTILNYSCTTPLPDGGLGNIAADPQLASPQSLSATSPCRGAGTSPLTATDIDDVPWGNPPSMGCYEYHDGPMTGPLTVNLGANYTNVTVGFPVGLTASIEGQTTLSTWDFGDGIVLSNTLNVVHSWAAPGDYSVVLRAYNDTSPGGVGAALTVHVLLTPSYYVAAANAHPQPPYSSWATAATNIQNAVDVALPGTVVMVTNGTYVGGVAVPKPLALVGVNGPLFTIIDGAGTNACASLASGASLTGFTATNGNGFFGGGVQCASTNAFLTNCTLAGNRALSGAGISGGTLYNCTLSGNSGDGGGGATGSTLYNCTLIGNSAFGRVASGGGAESCTLYNCTLRDNSSGWSGGGAADSTLNNCILTGNSSEFGPGGGAAHCTLNNCTLTGNSATNGFGGGGGGTYWCWLNNCISYYNISPGGANYETNYSYSTLNYCCTTPLPTSGFGNITNAPLFVDYAGGNLRLQSLSPCINSGNNAFVSGATDLDGNPRIVGDTVDMGAYEFQESASVISYAWLQQWGLPTDGSADYVDTDGDGMNNWQEWVCGTCPTNPLSVLRLLSASTLGANVTVTWQSVAGINYFLERGANLGSPFSIEVTNIVGGSSNVFLIETNSLVVATNIVGQAGTTSYSDTNAAGPGPVFYRVGVKAP